MDRGAGWATVLGMRVGHNCATNTFIFHILYPGISFLICKGIHRQRYFYPSTAGTTELALEELAGPWWSSPHSQRAFPVLSARGGCVGGWVGVGSGL